MVINGPYVRILRERSGVNATDFAKTLGISVQYLCDIEAGRPGRNLKRNPALIKKIAHTLDVPVLMVARQQTGEAA